MRCRRNGRGDSAHAGKGVAAEAQDIDPLHDHGRWPFHLGGITPYLDRSRSERVNGERFRRPVLRPCD